MPFEAVALDMYENLDPDIWRAELIPVPTKSICTLTKDSRK